MNRDEHLAWAKGRALQYLEEGNLLDALTSMSSDLGKHEELKKIGELMLPIGLLYVVNRDPRQLRAWIEGFN